MCGEPVPKGYGILEKPRAHETRVGHGRGRALVEYIRRVEVGEHDEEDADR